MKTIFYSLFSKALLGALLILHFFPTSVLAAECKPDQLATDLGCVSTSPGGFASSIYGLGLGLIGGVSVLFIIFGGFTILTSQGNPDQLNKGKGYIVYSIIGLVLAIFGFAFYSTIAVDVLKIPGFSK